MKGMRKLRNAVIGAGMGCGIALTATMAEAQAIVADHAAAEAADTAIPQPWLDKARGLTIYFAHQSVGANILAGLGTLAAEQPARYTTRIAGASSRWDLGQMVKPHPLQQVGDGGIAHFPVGRNGDGEGKVRDFAEQVRKQGRLADVAMMKLCYVDFPPPKGDPARLFAVYRDAMERLERDNPGLKLVWWTAPLTTDDNAPRAEFNRLVRAHVATRGKILFDIADIESHDPHGRPVGAGGDPRLFASYTDDGGHLSPAGQARAARAWWWLAARMAGWPGPSVAAPGAG